MKRAGSTSLRGIAKHLLEEITTRCQLDRVSRALRDARGAVLAYHNVVPDEMELRGEAALHVPRGRFARHLDAVARSHEVVPLEQLLTSEADSGPPRVAITFDDAYRGAVTTGLAETGKRGFPATVFVAPGLLGRDGFWWDRLADGDGTLDEKIREAALREEEGDQRAILDRWLPEQRPSDDGPRTMPDAYRPCSEKEIDLALANRPEVSVGSHTWSHRCLPACDRSTLEAELKRSDRWLRDNFGARYVSCVSYPYGRFCHDTLEVSRETYRWALKIDGGLIQEQNDPESVHAIPRINVPRGLSSRGLLIRLSGF